MRTAVPFLEVFLADHPSTYRTAGLRRGTATSSSTRAGTISDEPLWLIRAERNEGPDTIRLDIVVRGRHYRAERQLKTPGWHDYKTEIGSGELTLTVYGEVPRSSRELTTEVNELRQALTDRFNRMKSQR